MVSSYKYNRKKQKLKKRNYENYSIQKQQKNQMVRVQTLRSENRRILERKKTNLTTLPKAAPKKNNHENYNIQKQ